MYLYCYIKCAPLLKVDFLHACFVRKIFQPTLLRMRFNFGGVLETVFYFLYYTSLINYLSLPRLPSGASDGVLKKHKIFSLFVFPQLINTKFSTRKSGRAQIIYEGDLLERIKQFPEIYLFSEGRCRYLILLTYK